MGNGPMPTKPDVPEFHGVKIHCPTCPMFVAIKGGGDKQQGQCRAIPPVCMVMPQEKTGFKDRQLVKQVGMSVQSVFPVVSEEVWCGSHPLFASRVMEQIEQEQSDA